MNEPERKSAPTCAHAAIARAFVTAVVVALMLGPAARGGRLFAQTVEPGASVSGDATLFRIFLKDGTAIASYGEFARAGDRVIFTLPIGADQQRMASIGADAVDWARTDRYRDAVRAARYAATRGEADYAAMSTLVARTLTQISSSANSDDQLRLAEAARRTLANWPKEHFGYKSVEVHETLGVLDEIIGGLRAKAGQSAFDLNLVAGTTAPAPEPLLRAPSLQDSIAQVLRLASLGTSSAERLDLLRGGLTVLDAASAEASAAARAAAGRSGAAGKSSTGAPTSTNGTTPAGASAADAAASNAAEAGAAGAAASAEATAAWAAPMRKQLTRAIGEEERTDRSYASLIASALSRSQQRTARADVRGLTSLRDRVVARDERLGRKRPEQIQSLLATLEQRLDAARRLRLARDQWTARSRGYRVYSLSIDPAVALLSKSAALLGDIRSLAGPQEADLTRFDRQIAQLGPMLRGITPPVELQAAHASLLSAFRMAEAAATQRLRAITGNDMKLAWDASAAAAGALMLFERARADLAEAMKPPELP